ncbi:MAG: FIG00932085: hypothetical protein, partial [uncultured Ramlibacter sp.]
CSAWRARPTSPSPRSGSTRCGRRASMHRCSATSWAQRPANCRPINACRKSGWPTARRRRRRASCCRHCSRCRSGAGPAPAANWSRAASRAAGSAAGRCRL